MRGLFQAVPPITEGDMNHMFRLWRRGKDTCQIAIEVLGSMTREAEVHAIIRQWREAKRNEEERDREWER